MAEVSRIVVPHAQINPFLETARRIAPRLPASLARDLARPLDKGLRMAAEHVGAPRLSEDMLHGLFGAASGADVAFFRAGAIARAQKYAAAHALDPRPFVHALELAGGPAMPYPDLPDGTGAGSLGPRPPGFGGWSGGPGPIAPQPRTPQYPYALSAPTALAAGVGIVTNAKGANYTNGSNSTFIVTHITAFESNSDTNLVSAQPPTFWIAFSPSGNTKQWQKTYVPFAAFATYQPYGPIQNVAGYPMARWELFSPYVLPKNTALYAEATNPANFPITLSVGFVSYKDDNYGTVRIFWDELALSANQQALAFDSQQFTGDGDANANVTEVIMSGGSDGGWSAAGQATSPLIAITPDGTTGGTTKWTGINAAAVIALNTTVGMQGPFWRLKTPQVIPPGTQMNIAFQNQGAGATTANVGLVGYLAK